MTGTVKNIKDALVIDAVLILSIFYLLVVSFTSSLTSTDQIVIAALGTTAIVIVIGFATGLYVGDINLTPRFFWRSLLALILCVAAGAGIVALASATDLLQGEHLGLLLIALPLGSAAMIGLRACRIVLTSAARPRRLLFMAPDSAWRPPLPASDLARAGFLVDCVACPQTGHLDDSNLARLAEFAAGDSEERTIVVAGDLQVDDRAAAVFAGCMAAGCRIRPLAVFLGETFGQLPLDDSDTWRALLTAREVSARTSRALERGIDVVFATLALVAFAPIIAIILLAIRLQDGTPAIFRQTRVGLHGRPFVLFKFRTMRIDAESDGCALWAEKNDQRVTRLGTFLRAHRLDEVLQLINVLRGEMSLVGPRPERPEIVDEVRRQIPLYDYRHFAKPGITGWAQINFSYAATVEDTAQKTRYDLYYIVNRGPLLNMLILLQTIRVVIFADGAR